MEFWKIMLALFLWDLIKGFIAAADSILKSRNAINKAKNTTQTFNERVMEKMNQMENQEKI